MPIPVAHQVEAIERQIADQGEALGKAGEVRALLENPILRDAFDLVKADILAEIDRTAEHSNDESVHKAKTLLLELRCLGNVRRKLMRVVETGDLAKATVDQLQRRKAMLASAEHPMFGAA